MKLLHFSVCGSAASLAIAIAATLVSPGSVEAASWKCTAAKMKNYSYSGGSTAMIHLRGYSKGGRYSVRKVNAKKVTGKTKDGTSFTCVNK